MTKSQTFEVQKNGIVKGGSFQYSADTDTGRIFYSGSLSVGSFFFSKKVPIGPGQVQVDPKLFLSGSASQNGNVIVIPPVTMTVASVDPGVDSVVQVTVQGQDISGFATIDISGQYISVKKVTASGKVALFNINIEADPVVASPSLKDRLKKLWGKINE